MSKYSRRRDLVVTLVLELLLLFRKATRPFTCVSCPLAFKSRRNHRDGNFNDLPWGIGSHFQIVDTLRVLEELD